MKRTQRQYLADLIEAMSNATRFVEGMSLADLRDDLKTQLALERCFSIIGEAANKVDPALREAYPGVPWRDMIGMRNVVIHGYWSVKPEIVWRTIHERFPEDQPRLEKIFRELPPEHFDRQS